MNISEDQNLESIQRDYESRSLTQGYESYLKQQMAKEKREGVESTDDHQRLFRQLIPQVAKELANWKEISSAAAGKTHGGLSSLKFLSDELMAYLGLSAVCQAVLHRQTIGRASIKCGTAIMVELEAFALVNTDKKVAKRLQSLVQVSASRKTKAEAHAKALENIDEETGEVVYDLALKWGDDKLLKVGEPIVEAVLKGAEEIFERELVSCGASKRESIVRFTAEGCRMMYDMREAAAWMHSKFQPMVVPPRPWTSLGTGAYLDRRLAKQVQLVRRMSGQHRELMKKAIEDGSAQPVLDAVNALQATAFKIDTRILEIVEAVWEAGIRPSTSFPLANPPAPMPQVWPSIWESWSEEQQRAYRRRAKGVRQVIEVAARERVVLSTDIATASYLSGFERFFLPYSLDWRGRLYAVSHFNPQRSEHIKAQFRFADGVPVGRDGGGWLAIHLANCGDFGKVSKKPFVDRWTWVDENLDRIIQAAEDPMAEIEREVERQELLAACKTDEERKEVPDHRFWLAADKPFCFLQACMEYADYAASGFSEDFESSISVNLDGSCSGLQHLSCMMRSKDEAYHVNLVPRDTVGDVYSVVAGISGPTLERTATRGDDKFGPLAGPIATCILANGWGRSENKRPTMTYFYGSAESGMCDQYMSDIMRPLVDKVALGELKVHPYEFWSEKNGRMDGGYQAAYMMAQHAFKAIKTVAPKAEEAKVWLQQTSSLLAHAGQPVLWVTPMGMPVLQKYSEWQHKVVKMWLYDRSVKVRDMSPTHDKVDDQGRVSVRTETLLRTAETSRIDKRSARSAISPNVVHSGDGAHMQMTTVMAVAEGITSFLPIHDSFGTHAGNTQRFFYTIRRALVETYRTWCPFTEIRKNAESVLDDKTKAKLLPVPEKGDLELTDVMASLYAFA